MSFSVLLTSFFNDVKICVTSYFIYGVSHEGKYCTFNKILVRKASNINRKLLSLSIGVTKVNFMWYVFHNAQWYWSDNLCKLVTDQWRGSLGVRDRESCWFTEEIGTYMRCWESPGDLPLVIEIVVSVRSFCCAPLVKRHKISIARGRSPPVFPKNVYKNLLFFIPWCVHILYLIVCTYSLFHSVYISFIQ